MLRREYYVQRNMVGLVKVWRFSGYDSWECAVLVEIPIQDQLK